MSKQTFLKHITKGMTLLMVSAFLTTLTGCLDKSGNNSSNGQDQHDDRSSDNDSFSDDMDDTCLVNNEDDDKSDDNDDEHHEKNKNEHHYGNHDNHTNRDNHDKDDHHKNPSIKDDLKREVASLLDDKNKDKNKGKNKKHKTSKICIKENPTVPSAPMCYTQVTHQPSAEKVKKVDILLVPDTSGSLNAERLKVAAQLGYFVNQLPHGVDYQIGIMPAHGSRGSHSGALWKYKNEPIVLKSTEKSQLEITFSLIKSLTNMKGDYFADGGEEGLYSLSRGFDKGKIDALQAHGMLREDAALAIIFIADENDICYNYPNDVVPVADPDKLEAAAFKRDCAGITPESVYAKIKNHIKDRPLLISGIVYTDKLTMRRDGENELGYGYLDLINLNKGVAIDLASLTFQDGLKQIGELTTQRLKLISEINLEHTNNINVESLKVDIDSKAVDAKIEGDKVILLGELGSANSEIKVSYCENNPVPVPTDLPSSEPQSTPSPSPSPSPTDSPTNSPSPSPTPSPTNQPDSSGVTTPTPTPTQTPVETSNPQPTPSPTDTPTTSTPTPIDTTVPTPTQTPTPSPSPSPTPTVDPTPVNPPIILPPGAVDDNQDGIDDITGDPIF